MKLPFEWYHTHYRLSWKVLSKSRLCCVHYTRLLQNGGLKKKHVGATCTPINMESHECQKHRWSKPFCPFQAFSLSIHISTILHPNSFKFHRHVLHDPLLIPWHFIFQNHSSMTIHAPFCPFQAFSLSIHISTILHPNSFKFCRHVFHDPLLIPWHLISPNHSSMTIHAPSCLFSIGIHISTILHPNSFKFCRHIFHDPLLIPWHLISQNHSSMTIHAPSYLFSIGIHISTILHPNSFKFRRHVL